MNAGRDVERLIATWLAEEAPGRAPDRVLSGAGTVIDRTKQRRHAAVRDLRIPWIAWRPRTMFDRLAVAAVVAVLAIGTFTLGAALLTSSDNAAGPCPATFNEADAIDTFEPGLTQAQRAWGIAGGTPGPVRPGPIAVFEGGLPDAVVTIDPGTGGRCVLATFSARHQLAGVADEGNTLDWSPNGDALAIGFDGQLFIWTPTQLLRVWVSDVFPVVAWAPDGSSLAVGNGPDGSDDIVAPHNPGLRQIFANGSPDRTYADIDPFYGWLRWSPDGSRWIVAEHVPGVTAYVLIDVADGRVRPLDVDGDQIGLIDWIDAEHVLFWEGTRDVGITRFLSVPVSAPQSPAVVTIPEPVTDSRVVLSPSGRQVAYVVDGKLAIVDLTTPAAEPVEVAPGGEIIPSSFAWSPDGAHILFVTPVVGEPVTFALWTVNADGSQPRQIASGHLNAFDDPWRPLPAR